MPYVRINQAAEMLGVPEQFVRLLARVKLVRSRGEKHNFRVSLTDVIDAANDPILVDAVMRLLYRSGKYRSGSEKQLSRALVYEVAKLRGLIPLGEARKILGVSRQAAWKSVLRNCTVKRILSRWFIEPDERWEEFLEDRRKRTKKRKKATRRQ